MELVEVRMEVGVVLCLDYTGAMFTLKICFQYLLTIPPPSDSPLLRPRHHQTTKRNEVQPKNRSH